MCNENNKKWEKMKIHVSEDVCKHTIVPPLQHVLLKHSWTELLFLWLVALISHFCCCNLGFFSLQWSNLRGFLMAASKRTGRVEVSRRRRWNSPALVPSEPRSQFQAMSVVHKWTAVHLGSVGKVCASLVSTHNCRFLQLGCSTAKSKINV